MELDGLRGMAIGLVLVCHLFLIPTVAGPGTFWSYVKVPGRLAWSGVDSPNYFRAFYARRFFRILPMYTLKLVFFYGLVFLARWGYAKNLDWMLSDQLPWYSYPLFLQNLAAGVNS